MAAQPGWRVDRAPRSSVACCWPQASTFTTRTASLAHNDTRGSSGTVFRRLLACPSHLTLPPSHTSVSRGGRICHNGSQPASQPFQPHATQPRSSFVPPAHSRLRPGRQAGRQARHTRLTQRFIGGPPLLLSSSGTFFILHYTAQRLHTASQQASERASVAAKEPRRHGEAIRLAARSGQRTGRPRTRHERGVNPEAPVARSAAALSCSSSLSPSVAQLLACFGPACSLAVVRAATALAPLPPLLSPHRNFRPLFPFASLFLRRFSKAEESGRESARARAKERET